MTKKYRVLKNYEYDDVKLIKGETIRATLSLSDDCYNNIESGYCRHALCSIDKCLGSYNNFCIKNLVELGYLEPIEENYEFYIKEY